MHNTLMTQDEFKQLYDYLSTLLWCENPKTCTGKHKRCNGTLRYTLAWMKRSKTENVRDNVEKIVDSGGHCDCEVCLNVPPRQWKKTRNQALQYPIIFGEQKANEFVSLMLLQSVQLELWTGDGRESA